MEAPTATELDIKGYWAGHQWLLNRTPTVTELDTKVQLLDGYQGILLLRPKPPQAQARLRDYAMLSDDYWRFVGLSTLYRHTDVLQAGCVTLCFLWGVPS